MIREKANDFLIYVFSQDANLGAECKLALSQARYDVYYFADPAELETRIRLAPCHLLVVDVESLILPVHKLIESVLQISNEVRFIFLTQEENQTKFQNFTQYNVNFVLSKADKVIAQTLVFAVDATCENLFRLYQNQQLYEKYLQEKSDKQNAQSILQTERQSPTVRPYQTRIALFKSAESKENLLDLFYQQTPEQGWLYLKFAQTIQTFICVSYVNVPESWTEGLSFKVPIKEKDFLNQLTIGVMPDSLFVYLTQKFGVERIKFLPLMLRENLDGILISTQDISAEVAEDFSLMSLIYTNLAYESQPKYLDVEDSLTGFYNELFYKRILDKEIDRSKRSLSPLSLIKVRIDRLIEIESSYGKPVADEIIKKVAEQIKVTSRLPDYVCRTGENEFSLVLINCHRKGAAIRAERLRKALSAESYTKSGLKISVSQGISEYPTLTSSLEELNSSALRALNFIAEKGGDKICIYKAHDQHRPDFTVET